MQPVPIKLEDLQRLVGRINKNETKTLVRFEADDQRAMIKEHNTGKVLAYINNDKTIS